MFRFKAHGFQGIILGLISSLIWGSWPVISKLATIQNLSAVDITAIRFSVAGLILLPVLFCHPVSAGMFTRKGILLALGAGAPYVWLGTTGIQLSGSAHFGLIAPGTMLMFSTVGSVIWLSEVVQLSRLSGILLIMLGVLVVGGGSLSESGGPDTLTGDLMFAGCGLLWASYTLLCQHWNLNAWVATALVSVMSGVICFPVLLLNVAELADKTPGYDLLIQAIYQGIVVAIVALYCYSKAGAILGAGQSAVFACLVPPVSLVLSAVFLDESLGWQELTGIACVFTGMMMSLGMITFRSGVGQFSEKD